MTVAVPPLPPGLPYPKAVMELPTVRQSLLSRFDNCALTAAMGLEYEEGWSSHPQARGQLLHRALDLCLNTMADRSERIINPDVASGILLEVLSQRHLDPRDMVSIPMREQKDMLWTIRKWANEATFNIDDLAAIEERIETTITYPSPAGGFVERIVTGAIDALFFEGDDAEHAVVIDWKDTWGIPGPKEVSFEGFFQQRMYAMLVMRKYRQVQSVTLDERYVRFSPGDSGVENSRRATVFRSDMQVIEAQIGGLVERLDRAIEEGHLPWSAEPKRLMKEYRAKRREATAAYDAGRNEDASVLMEEARNLRRTHERLVGPWSPSPGAHCSFCPRPTACPIIPQARGAGRITDEASAERVAAETVAAEASSKKGKAALKEWADKHGPIPIKDAKGVRVWGHKQITRKISPKRAEVEAEVALAAKEGREPNLDTLFREAAGSRFEPHMPKPMSDDAGAEDADLMDKMVQSIREAEARRVRPQEVRPYDGPAATCEVCEKLDRIGVPAAHVVVVEEQPGEGDFFTVCGDCAPAFIREAA